MSDNLPSIMGQGANVPAHLQQYASQGGEAAGLVTSFLSLPSISLKGKQFRFVKDGVETPNPPGMPLRVVILGFDPDRGLAKSFYEKAYQPGTAEAPDCFSSDGITPDPFVSVPKCRSCTECPNNAFGSGKDAQGQPSKGKACGDHKNLFVVAADTLDGDIAVMRVPATSLKALSAFGAELSKHGVPPSVLITELSFTADEHPQLAFNACEWLSEADAARMVARSNSEELSVMKPSNNKGAQVATAPAIAAPPGQAALPGPETIPASVPSPTPPPPAAEPVKTMTEKAEVDYDSFIAQGWTDELLVEHGYMTIT